MNFPAIMPRSRRSRSLIWRHLSLSLREAGLEGETKEEKRKATFSFLYFGFPPSPARAPCSSPTPRTKVHAPRSSLASPKKNLRVIACQQTFFSFIFFVFFLNRILRAVERSEHTRTSGQYSPRGFHFIRVLDGL